MGYHGTPFTVFANILWHLSAYHSADFTQQLLILRFICRRRKQIKGIEGNMPACSETAYACDEKVSKGSSTTLLAGLGLTLNPNP